MEKVDYAKLSGQYASFLVAVGGVSITVLTLVLGFRPPQDTSATNILTPDGNNARVFLVAALIAATVSCFIGAHMMAETAAFLTRGEKLPPIQKPIRLGRRLFVLATINIFIAIALVLFSLVLLPTATGEVKLAASLKPISLVFPFVAFGALVWMALATIDRMAVGKKGWIGIAIASAVALVTAILCYRSNELWLQGTFIFIVSITAASLLYFAIIFRLGDACTEITGAIEIGLFSLAITISYAFLVVAYLKILWGTYSFPFLFWQLKTPLNAIAILHT